MQFLAKLRRPFYAFPISQVGLRASGITLNVLFEMRERRRREPGEWVGCGVCGAPIYLRRSQPGPIFPNHGCAWGKTGRSVSMCLIGTALPGCFRRFLL